MITKNLFIVGAAKSGTTTLHHCLDQHPQISMSNPKEPKFFSYKAGHNRFEGVGDYLVKNSIVKSEEEYEKTNVIEKNTVILGESSADYLYYYEDVASLIKEHNKDAKIIIVLRDPSSRAFSAYKHLVRDGREKLSFSQALEQENSRKERGWEFIWHYKSAGFYCESVRSYIEMFDNVKVITHDDLESSFEIVIRELFSFIGVAPIYVEKINLNQSGNVRYKWLHNLFNSRYFIVKFFKKSLGKFLTNKFKNKIIWSFKRINTHSDHFKSEEEQNSLKWLKAEYIDDIKNLERLLGKDLSAWKMKGTN